MPLQEVIENPLIWPLLSILKSSSQSHKVHYLASELQEQGLLPDLDIDANKALFKRNFLLMNALYQLQAMLLPEYWLQVRSLDIQLVAQIPSDLAITLEQDVALREYYLNWDYFETSPEEVESLLSQFWGKYGQSLGSPKNQMDKSSALQIFELDERASVQDIRRQWRKLALKWHPDRNTGNANHFRLVCEAWQTLRES
tara:strand:- start:629 stop:1225 length:597 start_codon:yes stop_codon:yes gene_type:complete